MGEYDECLDVKNPKDDTYQTQFCWAHLNLPIGKILAKSGDAVKTLSTTCGAGRPTDVKMSICMPRSCSEYDLKLALNHLQILPISSKNQSVSGNDEKFVCDVTCRPVDFQPDFLFWMVTIVLGITVFLCVFATVADYYLEVENEKVYMESGEKKVEEVRANENSLKYFLAFSMLSNGRSLLRISKNPNNLRGVECIRFLSFTWVVSGHIWGDWENADNPLKAIDILKTRSYEIWVNAFFSVDTFFFLSGLLLSYSFLPKLTIRKAMSPTVWFIFYLHRILRLTPAYLSFILFYATYGPLTDFGPNEIVRREDMENCRRYGWKNLLYINNIYEPRKNCLSISWYMAADTQMYLISPIFLISFLLGLIPGIVISITVILLSTILNYWLFVRFDLPLTLIQAYMTGDDNIIHVLQDLVYEAAYIRIPPFIFGIAMGYLMLKTRNTKIHFRTYLTKVIPSVVASCIFATIWTLLFEIPSAKLESFALLKLMKTPEKDKVKECTKI
uniref:Acyl_transf_3 domain-containing protein n=1 Tax=Caenorhabditis tropicalis TaxID=1561998 RepID=A0A1I7TDH3_9PELO